jgi:hypothetical protein
LGQPVYGVPGWFSAVELDVVKPHIQYGLASSVALEGPPSVSPVLMTTSVFVSDIVQLPMAALDWSAAPRIEFGYRLADGCGELMATYRSVVSEGSEILPGFDALGAGELHSRLDLEVVDLDYGSHRYMLGSNWGLQWIMGVRFVDIFMDSQADNALLDQRSSERYWGIGPHAGVDLWHRFGNTGLSCFGKVEAAALLGRIHQGFAETSFASAGNPSGATAYDAAQAGPTFEAQTGLDWRPWTSLPICFSAGYQIEEWWNPGTASGGHATLFDQGLFLRAEWNF